MRQGNRRFVLVVGALVLTAVVLAVALLAGCAASVG